MKIGNYQFIKELGVGGMARVSLCTAPDGRMVVIKQPLVNDAVVHEQLRDEARNGARIDHPNVVETLDCFDHNGLPCLAVAYVPGATLYQLRKRSGMLPQPVVARVARQICEALHALHLARDAHGKPLNMLHRDISPSNIILGHDGNARLIDLGIARSSVSQAPKTRTGLLRGKIAFFAPELFDGKPYSIASDLWALGVVLFEAVLGRPAIVGSQAEIMGQICAGTGLRLKEDEQLDPVFYAALSRLINPNPRKRIRNAQEAANMFAELEDELGATQGMAARVCQARARVDVPVTHRSVNDEHNQDRPSDDLHSLSTTHLDIVSDECSDISDLLSGDIVSVGSMAAVSQPSERERSEAIEQLESVFGFHQDDEELDSASHRISDYVQNLRSLSATS